MKEYKNYNQLKKELLYDVKIRKGYDELKPHFELVRKVIRKRIQKGLSQKEFAKRIGTTQSAISRFESGSYNPTVLFLQKVASALDAKLTISVK